MYYVHGRWWRADLGIFISPSDESGEYRYGSGQDGINDAWIVDTLIAFGQQGDWQRSAVLGTGAYIQDSVTATHYAFYPPDDWTLADRFGNAARVYEPAFAVQSVVVVAPLSISKGVPYLWKILTGTCAIKSGECASAGQRILNSTVNSVKFPAHTRLYRAVSPEELKDIPLCANMV